MVSIAFGGSVFLFCFRAFGAYIHNIIYMSIEYFIMRIHLNSEVSVCVLYDSYFPFFFSQKNHEMFTSSFLMHYEEPFVIWGFPKMVCFPNKPMGFPD